MDLAHTFCPNWDCPARGQTGQGNISIHSRQEHRFICKQCRKTFTATKGTTFYRLRTPAETVSLVLTLMAHGCPLQAIVVAFGFDERTVATWFARAGRQAQAVQEHVVEQPRDLGLIRRLLGRVRHGAARRPLLICTDGFRAYPRAIRETFRDPLPTGKPGRPRWQRWKTLQIAQVVKHYVQRRVAGVERRIVAGTAAQIEKLRRRSQGGPGVINTAYIERLNATFRERLAALTRRGRARARYTATLQAGMYLIGTVYNFCTYHTSLSRPLAGISTARTPAMAAAITTHRWTVQELLSFHVPPPLWTPPKQRGRPSRTLQR